MSLIPVYQYHTNNGFLRYFYTTLSQLDGKSWNSVPKDDVQNWTADGIAFYSCASGDPNAVAVYQMYAPPGMQGLNPADTQKYLYTTDANGPGGGWYQTTGPNGQVPAFYAYSIQDAGLVEYAMWYIDQPQYSFFLGCGVQNAVTGALQAPSGWSPVGWANTGMYLLPAGAQLSYDIEALSLTEGLPTGDARLVGQQLITNNSKYATIAQDISYSLSLASSVTISLTESLSATETNTVEVDIPEVGKISTQLSVSVGLSSTQSQTTTTTQTVDISSTVTVGPNSAVTVDGIVYVLTNYSIPIVMPVTITAEANGVPLNAAAAPGSPCQALLDLFKSQNQSFTGTITPEPQTAALEVSLNATITCSFGVNTELVVADAESASSSTGVLKRASAAS